jgi:hypothetical protein
MTHSTPEFYENLRNSKNPKELDCPDSTFHFHPQSSDASLYISPSPSNVDLFIGFRMQSYDSFLGGRSA